MEIAPGERIRMGPWGVKRKKCSKIEPYGGPIEGYLMNGIQDTASGTIND